MGIAIDASTPIRWTGTPNDSVALTSASFTPPAGSLLVLCLSSDSTASQSPVFTVATTGLTWTKQIQKDFAATGENGHASIWTCPQASSAARTCAVTRGSGSLGGTKRVSCKLYAITGQDASPVGASGGGGSTTNNMTASIFISTGANSLAVACATDWAQLGVPTSSDLTVDGGDYSGAVSVMSGYKALGSIGSQTANIHAGSAGTPNWNWVALEILAPAATGIVVPKVIVPQAVKRASYF